MYHFNIISEIFQIINHPVKKIHILEIIRFINYGTGR